MSHLYEWIFIFFKKKSLIYLQWQAPCLSMLSLIQMFLPLWLHPSSRGLPEAFQSSAQASCQDMDSLEVSAKPWTFVITMWNILTWSARKWASQLVLIITYNVTEKCAGFCTTRVAQQRGAEELPPSDWNVGVPVGTFPWSMIDVEEPRPLWTMPLLGKWCWAVQKKQAE